MPAIDYAEAQAELERLFATAEERFRQNPEPQGPAEAIEAVRVLFASSAMSAAVRLHSRGSPYTGQSIPPS